jgi:hypothetical protein
VAALDEHDAIELDSMGCVGETAPFCAESTWVGSMLDASGFAAPGCGPCLRAAIAAILAPRLADPAWRLSIVTVSISSTSGASCTIC